MRSLYSLWRLCWRPQTVMLLMFLVPAVLWPLEELARQVDGAGSALWRGEPAGPVRAALWHMLLLAPVVPGMIVAWSRLELQVLSGIGWTLPDLRRRLAVGTLLTGAPVAAVFAVLLARADAGSSALAGFFCAFAWFLLPGAALDVATPRAARWAVWAALLAGLSWPGAFESIAGAFPGLASLAALAAVVAMAWLLVAPVPARRRPGHSWAPGEIPAWLERLGPGFAEWRVPLTSGRFMPWLQAAAHERGSFLFSALLLATIAAAGSHLLAGSMMLFLFAGMGFNGDGTILGDTLTHPVSRIRRADIAWAGTVLDAATFCVLAALVLLVISPLPHLFAGEESWRETPSLPVMLGFIFALAPIPRWGVILWGRAYVNRPGSHATKRFLMIVPYMAASIAVITGSTFVWDGTAALIRVGLLALVCYALHWAALRRYYRSADLAHA